MRSPVNVLHVTTGMGRGGSESMLARLVAHTDPNVVRHHVLALSDEGPPWKAVLGSAASALNLKLNDKSVALTRVRRLPGFARACRADVIQGWMYHGNYFASWMRRLYSRKASLIFGIRQSLYEIRDERSLTRFVIRRGAAVSRGVDAVLYNSAVSRAQHEAIGYRADIGAVIPNGFDTEGFRPDAANRETTRLQLGLTNSDFAVGIVGRFHPVKDHATFIAAAGLLAESLPRARFLVAGPGCTADNAALQEMLAMHGQGASFQLLGDWNDTRRLYPALDVLCLTSRSEGFPNVLGEAMSCGVPCVATPVGDIPSLVGDPEWLVQPGDSKLFASRLRALADLDSVSRARLSDRVRARIVSEFGIDSIVEKYLQLYARARENPRRAD